jgi:hypothetical protein
MSTNLVGLLSMPILSLPVCLAEPPRRVVYIVGEEPAGRVGDAVRSRGCAMTETLRRLVRAAALLALCAVVVAGVSGCGMLGIGPPPPAKDGAAPEVTTSTPLPPPQPAAADVTVPSVLGKYYDDAAQAITDAGLTPVDMSVYGPTDEDAGEIGLIYRQTPKAGEKVAPGTKVELRSWWETQ